MENENEELKYKTVTYTVLIFLLLYFVIHVGLSFYPANETVDPISKEGFWFYVRVFAPMIGAAIGAFASFKAAIYTFNQNKLKEEKKEEKRLIELKELILTCLIQTNLKLDEATAEVLSMGTILAKKIHSEEFLLELNHNFEYLPPENLYQIKKEDFYKLLIIDQKTEIQNVYTYYDYFIQSLTELKRIQNKVDNIFKEIDLFFIDFKNKSKDFFEKLLEESDWDSAVREFIKDNQHKYMIKEEWLNFLDKNFAENKRKILIESKSLFRLHNEFFDMKLKEFELLLKNLIKVGFLFITIINLFFDQSEVKIQQKKISSLNKLIENNYNEIYEAIYYKK